MCIRDSLCGVRVNNGVDGRVGVAVLWPRHLLELPRDVEAHDGAQHEEQGVGPGPTLVLARLETVGPCQGG
eukprot:5198430-Alexandrium_andersonii.AAC.1